MSDATRVLIVAGEPSGDLLGAQLMQAARGISTKPITFLGVGGHNMAKAGLYSIFPISDIALMGAAEIIPRLRNIFRRMDQVARFVADTRPEIVILIDSPEFNLRLGKRIRKLVPQTPIALYVAPQVWASRPGRARKMSTYVDHIFSLLPFEEAFFQNAGIPCTAVGHPVIERKKLMTGGVSFRQTHDIPIQSKIVCLLPGSRLSEVKRLLPIFQQVTDRLKEKFSDCVFVTPVVPHVKLLVQDHMKDWKHRPIIVETDAEKYSAFDASNVALAASGTVALELALARVPSVVTYRMDPVTAFVARRIITTRFVNLVNLIVDHAAIPEFIQQDCTVENLVVSVSELLSSEDARATQLCYVDKATDELGLGQGSPSIRAAQAIWNTFIKKGTTASP